MSRSRGRLFSREESKWWDEHFRMMEPESEAEWEKAWEGLAKTTGDADLEALDEESGEVWQYMGSTDRTGRWLHEFRHRCHPRTKERTYVRVDASPGWPASPQRRRTRRALSAQRRRV